jgi:hypothetical protein
MSDSDGDASIQPPSSGPGSPNSATHPVWAAAAGGGRGRGRGRPRSDAGDRNERYERISLAVLEQNQRKHGDGADSRIDSDDEGTHVGGGFDVPRPVDVSKRKADDGSDEEEDEGETRKRSVLDQMLGAAAFGSGGDTGSEVSQTESKRMRDASKDAFPLRGITCVGCSLVTRIGAVDKFVKDNLAKMTEEALFKSAALVYRKEVVEKAEAEGAVAPPWSWKSLRSHYLLHSTDNLVGRHQMLRNLQMMRSQTETQLVKVDGEDRSMDKAAGEMMLKIIAAESRERAALDLALATAKRAAGK